MAVKYTIPYRSVQDEQWRVDISHADYTDNPIQLRTARGQACVITYNNSDDPFQTIVNSKAAITIIKHDAGLIDVRELQYAQGREFIVEVFKENVLFWKGFLVPFGIQEAFKSMPFDVQITAVDGLKMLEGIKFYSESGSWAMPVGISKLSPLAYIRKVLFRDQSLNLRLPIRWTNSLQCLAFPGEDSFAGSVEWSTDDFGIIDSEGNFKSCNYVLEGLLKSHQMRIYQRDGKWIIERINDIVTGNYSWKEIDASFHSSEPPVLTTGTVENNKELGIDYVFIQEDALLMVEPAIKSIKTTYKQDNRENVLPNGGQDISEFGIPVHWALTVPLGGSSNFESTESITKRKGFATTITSEMSDPPHGNDAIFKLNGNLPIDANVLYRGMTLGFTFCPQFGFPFDNDTGIINWDSKPLRMRVSYNIKGKGWYYLNGFGYWQQRPFQGYLDISEYRENVSANRRIFEYTFVGHPLRGDTIVLKWKGGGGAENIYIAKTVVGESDDGNLFNVIQNLANDIVYPGGNVSLFNGGAFVKLTFSAHKTASNNGYAVGSGKNTLDPDLTIPLSIQGMQQADIGNIQFTSKGNQGDIIIPDPGDLSQATGSSAGSLTFELFVKEGQQIIFDEIYIKLNDNNDVYESELETSKYTNKDESELNISSSFNGFYVSNLMTRWDRSDSEFEFTDGKSTGSLTKINSEAIMRFKNKPSTVFEGTVYGTGWSYGEIYKIQTLEGKKFMPLRCIYNTENCTINVTAIECRDDVLVLNTKHYGSNDKQLSN